MPCSILVLFPFARALSHVVLFHVLCPSVVHARVAVARVLFPAVPVPSPVEILFLSHAVRFLFAFPVILKHLI